MNSQNLIIICLVAIVSTVCYQVASGQTNIVENFWNTGMSFIAKPEITTNGYANPKFVNNTPILGYDTNPIINTQILSPKQKKELVESLKPTENYCGSCTQGGPPVYTVPGTKQSYLPPRMNADGIGSYVKYEIPKEEHLGGIPSDPLSVSNVVSKEDFKGTTIKEADAQIKSLRGQGDLVFNELPVSSMSNSLGTETENDFFVNSERLIFALKKDRNTGNGCMIRGDLGIIPNNGDWFQVSANPATLTQGALMAIAGPTNVTSQQAAELAMRAKSGTTNTYGGGNLSIPPNTFVSELEKVNSINMGNKIDMQNSFNGVSPVVQATAFP